MTSCAYGTRRKSGTTDWIWVLSRAFFSWFTTKFSRIGGIAQWFVPDSLLSADTLCATEITVPSAPSLGQWVGKILGTQPDTAYVDNYLAQLFLSYLWDSYCECVPASAGTCATISVPWTTLSHTNTGDSRNHGITISCTSGARTLYGAEVFNPPSGVSISRLIVWDSTTTTILRQKNTTTPAAGHQTVWLDSPLVIPNGSAVTVAYSWTGTDDYYYWGTNAAPPASDGATYSSYHENSDYSVCPTAARTYKAPLVPLTCSSGAPGGFAPPYTPVEPTDPTGIPDIPVVSCTTTADICARLSILEGIARFTQRSAYLTLESTAPEAWSAGTTASGLTGHGALAVSDILGVFVSASVPSTWGKTYQVPARLVPAYGSVQWSIDGVPVDEQLLHYDEQHVFGAPPSCDEVIWNFKPGVTASITPLLRYK